MIEGEQHDPGKFVNQSYVCGFMFTPDYKQVYLIRKNRPDWQKGKLNGIGGKIEPGESAFRAMVREFNEEAGIETHNWFHFCTLDLSRGGSIYCYWGTLRGTEKPVTKTDELVMVYDVKDLQLLGTMPNVQWLIPMARSFNRGEKCVSFVVKENENLSFWEGPSQNEGDPV